jgi:hypothetical protein
MAVRGTMKNVAPHNYQKSLVVGRNASYAFFSGVVG